MHPLLQSWEEKAKQAQKTICFPEALKDERIFQAGLEFQSRGLGKTLFIGSPEEFKAKNTPSDIQILDPETFSETTHMAELYNQKRAKENLTPEQALETIKNVYYFGAMLVELGHADGMVAGSICPTSTVLRAALKCVGPQAGMKTVSAALVMLTQDSSFGENGALIFSDCAVVPEPTSEQLVDIAAAASQSCQNFLGSPARLAFLSFSTQGSAVTPQTELVAQAATDFKSKYPEIIADGELQLDAALVPSVAELKCPNSKIQGNANTLIFPNLSAGNIGYKLVQRLGKAEAIGPIIQGLAKPINDLSRGCSVEDIIQVGVITSLQSQSK